jgi:adenine-specific DNA-methyltransferase
MAQVRTAERALPIVPAAPADTLEAGRVMSRALAASVREVDRRTLAYSFGHRLITAWWQALTAADIKVQPLREPLQAFDLAELPSSAQALADSIGKAAAQLDPETAAYQIGLAYTGMLPAEHRRAQGIYYTPPALTARLIAQATEAGADWTTARVLDPACGGGAFLTPIAQRIIEALPGCSPRILIQNIATRLRGYELDPFGAWLSQVALDAAMLPVSRAAGRRLPVLVTVCDSLNRSPPRERFDLVIGNPPYGRVTLPPAERARFKRSLYGHANLYGLFTDMALRHAKPGGIIAYVTPTSFLAGEYFKNLRALLGHDAPPATIDFVSVRKGVFDDVLQETLLATYRRGASAASVAVHEITPANGAGLTTRPTGTIGLPVDPSQPWILPRNPLQAPLVACLAGMTHRLADWGYAVSTGPLVWNRYKDQLANAPGRNRHPLIWAEAVTSYGRFIYRAEKRSHTPYFEVRRGDDWLIVDYPCVLLQRTTAKEQPRRLIAAALPDDFLAKHGAVVIENHLNMLRPIIETPSVTADVLAAFVNSAVADRAFRCVSGSVAVSAYELEALPLPAPGELGELRHLVRQKASRQRIEAACTRLYDEAG